MNNVRNLRKKAGIQQKELALVIGVANATVSDWEHGRKNPSGERLQRLANYFHVDKDEVLGIKSSDQPNLFIPEDPEECGVSETDQIINRLLEHLDGQPKTEEARILAKGVDKLPKEQRELALNVVKAIFMQYEDYFKEDEQ